MTSARTYSRTIIPIEQRHARCTAGVPDRRAIPSQRTSSLHAYTSGGAATGLVGNRERRQHRRRPSRGRAPRPGVHRADRRAGLDPVTHLRCPARYRPRGRSARPCGRRPAPSRAAASPSAAASTRARKPARSLRSACGRRPRAAPTTDRRRPRDRPAARPIIARNRLQRGAVGRGRGGSVGCAVVELTRRRVVASASRREPDRRGRAAVRPRRAAQDVDRLGDVQRVADRACRAAATCR